MPWGRYYHNSPFDRSESWSLEREVNNPDWSVSKLRLPASGTTTPPLSPPNVCLWLPLSTHIVITPFFLVSPNSLHIEVSWWVIIRPWSLSTGPKWLSSFPLSPPASRVSPSATQQGRLRSLSCLREQAYGSQPQRNLLNKNSGHIISPDNPGSSISTCHHLGALFPSM